MCLATRIEEKLAKKAALDAEIAKLEKIITQKSPLLAMLREILNDIEQAAPEELLNVWQEILVIGREYESLQLLVASELEKWQLVRTENVKNLQAENKKLKAELEEACNTLTKLEEACNTLTKDRDELLIRIAESQARYLKLREKEVLPVEALAEKYQKALTGAEQELAQTKKELALMERNPNQKYFQEYAKQLQETREVNTRLTSEVEELRSQLAFQTSQSNSSTASDENEDEDEDEDAIAQAEHDLAEYKEVQALLSDSILALTLWQPWATLVAQGEKKIETRSWSTPYRGPIAIHAAKKPIDWSTFNEDEYALPEGAEWPLGAVVAIATLVDCIEMTPELIAAQTEKERALGLWQPGRFAWILENVRPVDPPLPAKGGQKLWQLQNSKGWNGDLGKVDVAPEPEYEPEKAYDAIQSILKSKGFFQPDPNIFPDWDTSELYETYRGWQTFYSVPNGGVVAIGLNNVEYHQLWDGSTEYIQEIDPTFPKSLADYDEVVKWTRALIDEVENLEAPGQLALDFSVSLTEKEYDDEEYDELVLDDEPATIINQGKKWSVEVLCAEKTLNERNKRLRTDNILSFNQTTPEPIAEEADTERYRNFNQSFDLQKFKVEVRQHNNGEEFAGASFNFLREDGLLIYSKSLVATECGAKSPKELAIEIIETYWQKLQEKQEKEANPYAKEEDKFVELVKLTPAVGYLKRRDSGELLAAYAAFSNNDENGNKLNTFAKARAKKWAEWLRGTFDWKVEEPRLIVRMKEDPSARQKFAYELKITGKFSIGQLQKLAEEDFSLLPTQIGISRPTSPLPVQTLTGEIYRVKINSYEIASGTKAEMQARFEQELRTFGQEGRTEMRLVCGNEMIEGYSCQEFTFVPAQDFDKENPEYFCLHEPTKTNFRVYRSIASGTDWVNSIYPYNKLSTKEAAAVDAVRRSLKAEKAE